jgi:universal stress protein E
MKPPKRIMVAIKDPSARTMPAVRKAAQLARASGAKLELFHALAETVMVDALEARRQSLRDYERERHAVVMKRLEAVARRIRRHGIDVTTAAEWDYPVAEAIVRRALRSQADMIVAERHATRHVAGWMLAYTDWELLRNAPCPVLLVKQARTWHRPVVMTALDPFHRNAKPARLDNALLQASGQLATSLRGSLRIVHCVPHSAIVANAMMNSPTVVESTEAVLRRARKALAAEVARVPLPSHQLKVLEGAAREALPAAARALGADIVVMGAVSRSGLKRLFIGNTAEAVLDALHCDVLIVKPGRFQTKVPRRGRGAQLIALPTAMTG